MLAIQSIGLQVNNLVIKETGRTVNEIGFALITDGIYRGFGYIDASQQLLEPEDYLFFVQPQQDNRDVQRILSAYLRKEEASKETSS